MTIPVMMLLGFATWTVLLLLATVGVYRWTRILTGQVPIRDFRADKVEGRDWYRRAMRAHVNCVENLPVFGAIVFAVYASDISSMTVSGVSILILASRILQSLIHVSFAETNRTVSARFGFFFIQLIGFLWLAGVVLANWV